MICIKDKPCERWLCLFMYGRANMLRSRIAILRRWLAEPHDTESVGTFLAQIIADEDELERIEGDGATRLEATRK